ncbi:gliding motility-associated C-terminal domain-containing protein [Chondrinema litorale]|uniref:gliding motility-associated C-terminal domain-containing protein n=1 Tax=Chondrinema litorale TaxID=2994555 RepID=UPI002542F174|nr:gliding motility-associated C-terminal domain-containing protein [Chondrinema litorale]UZR92626.1 gliding motility-associated C-terminal domain-containing protein [Chondrinema litorale]
MKRLILLIFGLLYLGLHAQAQDFRLADNISDAQFLCTSEANITITNNFTFDVSTDPIPSCTDGGVIRSAWFKAQATHAGFLDLNFFNVPIGHEYDITVFSSDGNETNPALVEVACETITSGASVVSFEYEGTEPSPIFYVMIDARNDVEGSFSATFVNVDGNETTMGSPDPSVRANRVSGCWGDDLTNLLTFTNTSEYFGGNTEFQAEVSFVGEDVTGIDQTGWYPPTIISVNGVMKNQVVGLNGSFSYDDFPIGGEIVVASGYPGVWEVEVSPINHECFDAASSSGTGNSTVVRLVVQRTDENFEPIEDPLFCEQNDLDTWYGKARLLPEVNTPDIADWQWNFIDSNGNPIHTVDDDDIGFIANSSNTEVSFEYAIADEYKKAGFFVDITVQGTCGPAERTYNLQAYELDAPTYTTLDPICITDINTGNPLNFSVTNSDSFSPKEIQGTVSWDFGGLGVPNIIAGDNGEEITFNDNSVLTPGTYSVEATLTDIGDCFISAPLEVNIVAKAEINSIDTIPQDPNIQCNQFVFNAGDVVDFTFDVVDVLPAQGANVTVTYGGNVVTGFPVLQSTDSVNYSFQVTHTGNESDVIEIIVDNATFPTVGNCPTTQTIGMLLEKEEPVLEIAGSDTLCISDINVNTPVSVSIINADDILGGASLVATDWIIDDASAIVASESETSITFSSLSEGIHTITARVSYNSGICDSEISLPITVVTDENINISEFEPAGNNNPAEFIIQCNQFVFEEGDEIKIPVEIVDLVNPVTITVKRGNNNLYVFSVDSTQYTDGAYVVPDDIIIEHNGNTVDVITIEVVNQTYPNVCITSRTINLPLYEEGGPTLTPIAPTFCVSNINAANPVSFTVNSPTNYPDINTITWTVLDDGGNEVNSILKVENGNTIDMTGFAEGDFIIRAEIDYVSGCTEIINESFTVLPQPEFAVDNIFATATSNDCVDPDGYQVGDAVQYEFTISQISEALSVEISYPGKTETVNITSTADYDGTLNFKVIDETLQGDGITWRAGYIKITSANGCELINYIEIPVVENPLDISPSQDQTICVNGNTATLAVQVLSAPAGTPSFVWTGDEVPTNSTSSSVTLSNLVDGNSYTASVTITSADGICQKTINFTVNVNQDVPELTTEVITSPDNTDCNGETGFCKGDQVELDYAAVNPTGAYSVRIYIPGQIDPVTGDEIDMIFDHEVGDDPDPVLLTVEDEDIVGTISIWYQDQTISCAQVYEIDIPIIPLAVIADADDNQVCSGEVVRQVGVIPSCDDYTVDWSKSPNQDLITSALSGNNITIDFTGQNSGEYTFEAEVTGNSCSRIITQTIEFSDNLPDIITSSGNIAGFCSGDLPQSNIILVAGKSDGSFDAGQVTFDWTATSTANQQFISSSSSLSASSITVNIPQGTEVGVYEFSVLVNDRDPDNDCERVLTFELTVTDNATIAIEAGTTEVCDYSEVVLTAANSLSGTYRWTRLDADTRQVVETFESDADTLLFVTDEAGEAIFLVEDAADPSCIAGGEFTLTITSCDLDIPNAFTPGPNDQINATFEVPRIQYRDWSFVVYNRYGDIVYENENYDNSWDGEDLPEGTYYYLLSSPEKTKEYKGWVRIFRTSQSGDLR